jgi:hypothetical protein
MFKFARVILSILVVVFLGGRLSAEEIGRVQLGGKDIIVDGNGTWAYADKDAQTNAVCTDGTPVKSKKLNLSICVKEPWRVSTSASDSFEFQIDNKSDEIYAGAITERANLTLDALEYAIISNAASGTGARKEDIPVVKKSKIMINGVEWSYIEYDVNFKGTKFRFANYYVSLGDSGAAQFVYWCSLPYFEKNRASIESSASSLVVSDKIVQ